MEPLTVQQAYRSLYRAALHATLHASPARYQIRYTMRTAFLASSGNTFNPRQIRNTIEFLRRAGEHTGMEHRILRNLLHVRWWQSGASKDTRLRMVKGNGRVESDIRRNSWAQFDATLDMLNRSLDLCLR